MLKNTAKLVSLFFLLVLSFVYTDKVFQSARANDPIMKQIVDYKKTNDVDPVEPVIKDNEMILGYCGLIINEKESYKNMKQEDKFDESKIIYDVKKPNNTISNTYDYYIKQGNPKEENVALIFKVSSSTNIDNLLSFIAKYDIKASFFVDGAWLENNVETAFSMADLGSEIYNMGYDGEYNKSNISITNNMIESISLKTANYCINENKNENDKDLCKKKKMHTIEPTLIDPSISELKQGLVKGAMISFDVKNTNVDTLNLVIKTITSRGYNIVGLSQLIKE